MTTTAPEAIDTTYRRGLLANLPEGFEPATYEPHNIDGSEEVLVIGGSELAMESMGEIIGFRRDVTFSEGFRQHGWWNYTGGYGVTAAKINPTEQFGHLYVVLESLGAIVYEYMHPDTRRLQGTELPVRVVAFQEGYTGLHEVGSFQALGTLRTGTRIEVIRRTSEPEAMPALPPVDRRGASVMLSERFQPVSMTPDTPVRANTFGYAFDGTMRARNVTGTVGRFGHLRENTDPDTRDEYPWTPSSETDLPVKASAHNPPLVNGHYYAQANYGTQDAEKLVQYFDDDHRSERVNREYACNVLSLTDGSESGQTHISESRLQDTSYIEVERVDDPANPAQQEAEQPLNAGSAQNLEVFGIHADYIRERMVDATRPSDFNDGDYFYVKMTADDRVFITNHEGLVLKQLDRAVAGAEAGRGRTSLGPLSGQHMTVVKVGLMAPAVVDEADQEGRRRVLREVLSRHEEYFEGMNDALNTLANEKEWCSDYEAVIEPFGMPGRKGAKRNWNVVVEASGTVELSSPPSHMDDMIGEHFEEMQYLSTSSISFTGTMRVSLYVEDCTEDDVEEQISDSMIEDALGEAYSAEINDWSIQSKEATDD